MVKGCISGSEATFMVRSCISGSETTFYGRRLHFRVRGHVLLSEAAFLGQNTALCYETQPLAMKHALGPRNLAWDHEMHQGPLKCGVGS